MNKQRLRAIEWAATYLLNHEKRRCRCAGTCDRCKEWIKNESLCNPETILEILDELKNEHDGFCVLTDWQHDSSYTKGSKSFCEGVAYALNRESSTVNARVTPAADEEIELLRMKALFNRERACSGVVVTAL